MERRTFSTEIIGATFSMEETGTSGVYDYDLHNPNATNEEVENYYGSVGIGVDQLESLDLNNLPEGITPDMVTDVTSFLATISRLNIEQVCELLGIEVNPED